MQIMFTIHTLEVMKLSSEAPKEEMDFQSTLGDPPVSLRRLERFKVGRNFPSGQEAEELLGQGIAYTKAQRENVLGLWERQVFQLCALGV